MKWVDDDADLVEWYHGQGFTDGLPVVSPTPAALDTARKRAS